MSLDWIVVRQPLDTQQFSAPQRAHAVRLPGEYGDVAVKGAVLPMASPPNRRPGE
jgi:hypothetical protein